MMLRGSLLLLGTLLILQVSNSFSFTVNSGGFVPALRAQRSRCLPTTSRTSVPSDRAPSRQLNMALSGMESVPAILLSEEIFGQVAAGGVAIIFSGVIGALIVGQLVNLDELEQEWGDSPAEKSDDVVDDDEYDEGENVEAQVKKKE